MSHTPIAIVLLLAGLLLAGCGQKGPLYLPGDPSEAQTEIPELPPEATSNDEGDDGNADGPLDDDRDDER